MNTQSGQQTMQHLDRTGVRPRDWSNRLLIAAFAGIVFLTLYPFQLGTHAKGIHHASPFLLGRGAKDNGARDIILNILLFVPFGFALATKIRRRTQSWGRALVCAWLAGLAFSYCIEFLQLYIPERDSGWQDIVTNSTGSAVGFLIAAIAGRLLFKVLADCEKSLEAWFTTRRAAVIILIYLAGWSYASVVLQKQTHLQDWISRDCRLVIGNDATGWRPWNGRVALLEVWDRALPRSEATMLMSGGEPPANSAPLIKIALPTPPADQNNSPSLLPPSSSKGAALQVKNKGLSEVTSASAVNIPAASLIAALKRANQFSVRLVLQPPQGDDLSGSIFSITHPSGSRDIFVYEQGRNLVFWFRAPLTERRTALDWSISQLLATDRFRDVLFSYDGSEMRVFVDGKRRRYDAMGPGAVLASFVRHIKQSELNGYSYIYYAIVFLPVGALLGFVARKCFWRELEYLGLFVAAVVLAPAVLEWILLRENGRHFSPGNFALSAAAAILGLLWMNSDRHAAETPVTGE